MLKSLSPSLPPSPEGQVLGGLGRGEGMGWGEGMGRGDGMGWGEGMGWGAWLAMLCRTRPLLQVFKQQGGLLLRDNLPHQTCHLIKNGYCSIPQPPHL